MRRATASLAGAILGSTLLGYLVATNAPIGAALALVVVFAMLWTFARWAVIIPPVLWAVLADPVFLERTQVLGSRAITSFLDLWTMLALAAALLLALTQRETWSAFKRPAVVGVAAMWVCFLAAQVFGGNTLDPQGYWSSELRALVLAGWLFPTYLTCRERGSDKVAGLMVVAVGVAVLKGIVYWVLGLGILATTSSGYFRLFGSEEATIGLFAWTLAFAQLSRESVRGKGRMPWLVLMLGGAVLLLLSSLRAYWVSALVAVILVWLIGGFTGVTRSVRAGLGLVVGVTLVFGALSLLGGNFYNAAVSTRVSTLLGGDIATDASLSYRAMEFAGVMSTVGSQWLFGLGLGSTHRTVLAIFIGDASLHEALLRYVHNSFLWAFLKAGIIGVLGVVSFYFGLSLDTWSILRRDEDPYARAMALGAFVSVVMLVWTDLFNAHIASPRYAVILAVLLGWLISMRNATYAAPSEA